MSERLKRIALHRDLGFPTDWLEAITDEEYLMIMSSAEEKAEKYRHQGRKRILRDWNRKNG